MVAGVLMVLHAFPSPSRSQRNSLRQPHCVLDLAGMGCFLSSSAFPVRSALETTGHWREGT